MSAKEKQSAVMVLRGHQDIVYSVAITPDGKRAVSASSDRTLKVWDLASGRCTDTFKGHEEKVYGVAVTPNGKCAVSGSVSGTLKVWDLMFGSCTATLEGHKETVFSVDITPDGKRVVSGSLAGILKVWDLSSGKCLATMEGHTESVGEWAVKVTPDGKHIVSGSYDNTLMMWEIATGACVARLEGHTNGVNSLAITPDGTTLVTGSNDQTLKIWDIKRVPYQFYYDNDTDFVGMQIGFPIGPDGKPVLFGTYDQKLVMSDLVTVQCRATWEGHTGSIYGIAVTPNGKRVISGSEDKTLKVWALETGHCIATLEGHAAEVYGVAVTPDGRRAVSASQDHTLRVWELPAMDALAEVPPSPRYTNAKVVLVGETGSGKTGMAIRLAEKRWEITESTHGMEVRPLFLPQMNDTSPGVDVDISREVWLWDFAGQPDYRLIHQLYMDETALALMVMDPQKDDPFESLGHWEKALSTAVKRPFTKVLVAGRCDRGGMTVSSQKIQQYCKEHGYNGYIDTSAKTGDGCEKLKNLICQHIPWDNLPWTTTTQLFKTLKDAIITIKNEGVVLIRMPDLCRQLKKELPEDPFTEAEMRTTVGLLAGQGLLQILAFGDFVLLQPEYINNYASVVVRCARESTDEMGNVPKSHVLEGNLDYKDMKRLEAADEKILLRAMLQTFMDRSLCLEEETSDGTQLVFPSYFKRDRPELPTHPAILTTYQFSGPIDEIYATLVVRLYYTSDFRKDQLWKNAADFKTHGNKQAGFLLTKIADDTAELAVYFELRVPEDTQVSFIKYIHEHLLKRSETVERQRSYVCPHCGSPVEARDAVRIRIEKGFKDIICQVCEKRFALIDSIEQKFASSEFLALVRAMDEEAKRKLDNESLELILEGQAKAITGEAGHIYRELSHDHGIDAEIEFKNKKGEASGQKVYLQLKSGDSYLYKRKNDNKEIFYIKEERHAQYWQSHAYPVMLVIRNSEGEIRWMNVTDYLKKHPNSKQIEFDGEPFNAGALLHAARRACTL